MMQQAEVKLMNPSGLHARPAAQFVKTASRFKDTSIKMIKGEREIDAKSIISIMSLGASQGTVLIIRAEGVGESEAVHALVGLIESGFGEGA
ncbi:MAG: system phosphocarrier protein Hpr [Firmicutes bacterium]|nr:system phosphocarrier protein Hpr [Bacillota bacterium]